VSDKYELGDGQRGDDGFGTLVGGRCRFMKSTGRKPEGIGTWSLLFGKPRPKGKESGEGGDHILKKYIQKKYIIFNETEGRSDGCHRKKKKKTSVKTEGLTEGGGAKRRSKKNRQNNGKKTEKSQAQFVLVGSSKRVPHCQVFFAVKAKIPENKVKCHIVGG